MNVMGIAAAGITAAILSVIIGQYKPEFKIYISLISGVLILAAVLAAITPVIGVIEDLAGKSGVNSLYSAILLKSLAICYITSLAADTCRDAGETAIASKINIAGKIAILVLSVPLFQELTDIIIKLSG